MQNNHGTHFMSSNLVKKETQFNEVDEAVSQLVKESRLALELIFSDHEKPSMHVLNRYITLIVDKERIMDLIKAGFEFSKVRINKKYLLITDKLNSRYLNHLLQSGFRMLSSYTVGDYPGYFYSDLPKYYDSITVKDLDDNSKILVTTQLKRILIDEYFKRYNETIRIRYINDRKGNKKKPNFVKKTNIRKTDKVLKTLLLSYPGLEEILDLRFVACGTGEFFMNIRFKE